MFVALSQPNAMLNKIDPLCKVNYYTLCEKIFMYCSIDNAIYIYLFHYSCRPPVTKKRFTFME
jgi:hypothetical protein